MKIILYEDVKYYNYINGSFDVKQEARERAMKAAESDALYRLSNILFQLNRRSLLDKIERRIEVVRTDMTRPCSMDAGASMGRMIDRYEVEIDTEVADEPND